MTFDVDNRMTSWTGGPGTEEYGYLADNKRVWKKDPSGVETYSFYGVGGQKLVTYMVASTFPFVLSSASWNVYFGGKLIRANGETVVADRLGSVVARQDVMGVGGPSRHDYFPYGAEMGWAAPGNKDKFGTYHRDATTGMDYADQRYFTGLQGRFLSSDPYEASGGASEPGSWNRYLYVGGDPVNQVDKSGLIRCNPNYCKPSDPDSGSAWPSGNGLPSETDAEVVMDLPGDGGGGVPTPKQVVDDAIARTTDRVTKPDCAALFLAPGENNAEGRVALSNHIDSIGSSGRIVSMINTASINKDTLAFTLSPFNPSLADDEPIGIFLIEGRGFFTGRLANGQNLNTAEEFRGLSQSQIQEAILIHELLHYMAIVGRDARTGSGGHALPTWQLPNGQTVTGSAEVSRLVRDNCFK